MATNIDKALFQQPQGLEELAQAEEPIEIEIVDPEEVKIGLDGMEIDITPGEETDEDFDANLAEFVDESALATLSGDLISDIDS